MNRPANNIQHSTSSLFNFDVMKCINPDNLLFAEQISDDAWEFSQITNLKILDEFEGNPDELITAYKSKLEVNGIDVFNELNKTFSTVSFVVDLTIENLSTVDGYKAKLLKNYPKNWKYMACEDIFIQDSVNSIAENVLKQEPHYYD